MMKADTLDAADSRSWIGENFTEPKSRQTVKHLFTRLHFECSILYAIRLYSHANILIMWWCPWLVCSSSSSWPTYTCSFFPSPWYTFRTAISVYSGGSGAFVFPNHKTQLNFAHIYKNVSVDVREHHSQASCAGMIYTYAHTIYIHTTCRHSCVLRQNAIVLQRARANATLWQQHPQAYRNVCAQQQPRTLFVSSLFIFPDLPPQPPRLSLSFPFPVHAA